jgi:hypothetical protein
MTFSAAILILPPIVGRTSGPPGLPVFRHSGPEAELETQPTWQVRDLPHADTMSRMSIAAFLTMEGMAGTSDMETTLAKADEKGRVSIRGSKTAHVIGQSRERWPVGYGRADDKVAGARIGGPGGRRLGRTRASSGNRL